MADGGETRRSPVSPGPIDRLARLRVLIGDDHAIVRSGLRDIANSSEDVEVTREASSGEEVLEAVRRESFDVLLLDISMPGRDGFEILRQVRAERPKLPVLILSVHAEEQYAIRSLRSGAQGYLPKSSAPSEILEAIRRVAAGQRYISPQMAEVLAKQLAADGAPPLQADLSEREFQVLRLLAAGKTVAQLAEELALSPRTIHTYRARLLKKLNLSNTAQLISYALRHGLAQP